MSYLQFQHTATRRWLQEREDGKLQLLAVSTHSHPKVAALRPTAGRAARENVSTHSHPKVAAKSANKSAHECVPFQHTATRRWLPRPHQPAGAEKGFNTQPPEGGCRKPSPVFKTDPQFQHTATRRWLQQLFI